MNFQDSIRANMKTKEQVAAEQDQALSAEVENIVQHTLKNIHDDMMERARSGQYQTVNGKRVIECHSEVFMAVGYVVGAQTIQKGTFGRKVYKTYITFNSDRKAVADRILQRLREETAKDSLSVIGYRAASWVSGKRSTRFWEIPSFVDGFVGQNFALLVKCRMTV